MQRAQSISGLVGDFMKMEDERQKTTGALKGFLSDPYYQQQVNSNPELAGFAQKVQKGSASLGDVRQFLGTMTAMQSAREQQMKADQMEAARQYNQALREQTLANKAAIDAATAERTKQNQISDQLAITIKEFDDLENTVNEGGVLTSQQADRLESLRNNTFLRPILQGRQVGLDQMTSVKLAESQRATDLQNALSQQRLQIEELNATVKALQQPRLNAGERRVFNIGGKQISAMWDGRNFIDERTGAPLYVSQEKRDPSGNVTVQAGGFNPFLGKAYDIDNKLYTEASSGGGLPSQATEFDPGNAESVSAEPAAQPVKKYPVPNPNAIQALRNNPDLAPAFDAKFGPGAAAKYLGK